MRNNNKPDWYKSHPRQFSAEETERIEKMYVGDFQKSASPNDLAALKFYDQTVDNVCCYDGYSKDLKMDWSVVKARCMGRLRINAASYMKLVADQFNTTVEKMKNQWKHLK